MNLKFVLVNIFNSSVNITFYYNVLKFLHLLNKEYSGEYLTINTTEFMFGNIKKIIDENENVSFIKKENVRKYDVYDLNIRLSGSYVNKADPIDLNNSPIKNIEIIYNSSNCII